MLFLFFSYKKGVKIWLEKPKLVLYAVDISDEKIEEVIGYIKDNYPQYYSGAEMMELVMYYGFLLDYAYDDSEMLSKLGMDVYQAVKYVYRDVETVLDDSTKENKCRKSLKKLTYNEVIL